MLSKPQGSFQRPQASVLCARLLEPGGFIQVVSGPRQVGKTTLVHQVLAQLGLPFHYASADEPSLRGGAWLAQQWEAARALAEGGASVLVLDEIQKIPVWSESVKRLWDEDRRHARQLKVVLLGSAPLLVAQGLSESLAGRFEVLHLPHWSYTEMRAAFGFTLDQYLSFGGYPGAAALVSDPTRWSRYIQDSLIETSISRDVLLLTRVDKPVLLRRLFELACRYSGQVLSYTKMLGPLQDAGNVTTLAHYLELLSGAGMVQGLQKYAGDQARRRGSSPKLQVFNTAFMSAFAESPALAALQDPEFRGRLVESAVGAHLANAAAEGACRLYYWRDKSREVDFVLQAEGCLVSIEVRSGRKGESIARHAGSQAFAQAFQVNRSLLVGGEGIGLEDFLSRPVAFWLRKPA